MGRAGGFDENFSVRCRKVYRWLVSVGKAISSIVKRMVGVPRLWQGRGAPDLGEQETQTDFGEQGTRRSWRTASFWPAAQLTPPAVAGCIQLAGRSQPQAPRLA